MTGDDSETLNPGARTPPDDGPPIGRAAGGEAVLTDTTPPDRSLPEADRPARGRRVGSNRYRWKGFAFWSLAMLAVGFLWWRSGKTSDAFVLGLHQGKAQGVLSHRGQLVFAISSLSLGPERSWTLEHVPAPVDEGDWLHDAVTTGATKTRQKWGFGYAISERGDMPDLSATWSALYFPHWAGILLCLPGWLRSGNLIHVIIRRRRRLKMGLCAECGYDLRGISTPICPECGTPRPTVHASAGQLPAGRPAATEVES